MPGPGRETAFESYWGAEYERVLGLALALIHGNTLIDGELAERLARKIAHAHANAIHRRLSGGPLENDQHRDRASADGEPS